MIRKSITLNRPAFTQQVFDSSGLTVLTSLFYRFTHEGDFDMIVRNNQSVILRCNVHVEGKSGRAQTTLDLAALEIPKEGLRLDVDSVLCFFVSKGTGRYTVTITEIGERQKNTLLDNSEIVPEGGIFAVTLTRPGNYRMHLAQEHSDGKIHVRMPEQAPAAKGETYRTEQAAVIEVDGKGNFKPNAVNIYSGQSVVFVCHAPVRIQVVLEREQDDDVKKPPFDRKPERREKPNYRGKGDKKVD
jgi:hypothetical protein